MQWGEGIYYVILCFPNAEHFFPQKEKKSCYREGADAVRGQQALAPGRNSSHTPVAGVGSTREGPARGKGRYRHRQPGLEVGR